MIWSFEVHATSLTLTRICQTASPYLAWLQSRLIIFRIILLIPWSDIRHVMSLWIYHDNVESHDVLFYLMNDLCSRLDISLLQEVMSQRQICWWSIWHFRIGAQNGHWRGGEGVEVIMVRKITVACEGIYCSMTTCNTYEFLSEKW